MRDRPDEPLASLRALIVNEREARNLTGLTDPLEAGRRIAARGCPVIVTRGEHGAVAVAPDGRVVEAAAAPATAADTVGAGDLFTAAFVLADLADRSIGGVPRDGHRLCLPLPGEAVAASEGAHAR